MSKWYDDEPHDDAGICEHVANLRTSLSECSNAMNPSVVAGATMWAVNQFLVNLALGQPDGPDREGVLHYLQKLYMGARRMIIETWTRGGPK